MTTNTEFKLMGLSLTGPASAVEFVMEQLEDLTEFNGVKVRACTGRITGPQSDKIDERQYVLSVPSNLVPVFERWAGGILKKQPQVTGVLRPYLSM